MQKITLRARAMVTQVALLYVLASKWASSHMAFVAAVERTRLITIAISTTFATGSKRIRDVATLSTSLVSAGSF